MYFIENLEMTHAVGGERGGKGHVFCVIMTHCVQKSPYPLDLNTFETSEKVDPDNYD